MLNKIIFFIVIFILFNETNIFAVAKKSKSIRKRTVATEDSSNSENPPKIGYYFKERTWGRIYRKSESKNKNERIDLNKNKESLYTITDEKILFDKDQYVFGYFPPIDGRVFLTISSGAEERVVIEEARTEVEKSIFGALRYPKVDIMDDLSNGIGWKNLDSLVSRGFGFKIKEDAIVYYNADPGTKLTLLDSPGGNAKKCKPLMREGWDYESIDKRSYCLNINEDCVEIDPGIPLKVVDSDIVYNRDPGTYITSPQLYYKVEVQNRPKKEAVIRPECPHETNIEGRKGWVAANQMGNYKREGLPSGENPLTAKISLHRVLEQKSEINESDSKTQENTKDKDPKSKTEKVKKEDKEKDKVKLEKLLANIGNCYATDYVAAWNAIEAHIQDLSKKKYNGRWNSDLSHQMKNQIVGIGKKYFPEKMGTPFDHFVVIAGQLAANTKFSNLSITNQQLYIIDALARTLYGEMRSCSGDFGAYYKAVAKVLFNRAKKVSEEGVIPPFIKPTKRMEVKNSLVDINTSYKGKAPELLLPDIVSSYYQISSWNRDDLNIKVTLCPINLATTDRDWSSWIEAVKVAQYVVLKSKEFEAETKEIKQTHYTSGMTPSWSEGKKGDTKFSIGGQSYGDEACLTLWPI